MAKDSHPLESCQPLGDRLVVKRDVQRQTSGGIALPDTAASKQFGTVLAVGPGRYLPNGDLVPVAVKPGQRVILASGAGAVVPPGTEYVMAHEAEIMGVLE